VTVREFCSAVSRAPRPAGRGLIFQTALVIAIAGALAAVAACRGGGAAPKGTVTIPVITPTHSVRFCQNEGYPAEAPQFGDNATIAYQSKDVPFGGGVAILRYFDHVTGTGSAPVSDSILQVRYTGWLNADCIFDTSYSSVEAEPVEFPLSGVITGWEEGMKDMKAGGKRRIEVPPALAYGNIGFPPVIPANATLIFELELTGVLSPADATATVTIIRTATATVRDATATAIAATVTAQATPVTPTASASPGPQ